VKITTALSTANQVAPVSARCFDAHTVEAKAAQGAILLERDGPGPSRRERLESFQRLEQLWWAWVANSRRCSSMESVPTHHPKEIQKL
jgi:hypothetical protein